MKLVSLIALGCVPLLTAVGCGRPQEPTRTVLQGKVTYEGKPVAFGTVSFHPDRAKGNKGVFGVAEIKNGVYQTNPGYGATLGHMMLSFEIYDGPLPEGKVIAVIQKLFVEIPPGTATKDFDLTEKMTESNDKGP